ncbi:MAG: CvpA family protein [Clostridiales bacterium]|nr:CvpA family protein [Clostridiales bacterium]
MMLYGHYRGFIRQCVSVGALVLTLIIVKLATPWMTEFIRDNPSIRANAAQMILGAAGWEAPLEEEIQLPSAQRISIEQMNLPQSVKDILLENNNSEIYQLLGVDQFTEYVSTCLADMLINTVSTILLFLVISIVIHILIRWLDLISRLPIISGLNHIAGAILGLAQGLLLLWIAGFILSLFSATPLGQQLEVQVHASPWLTFLYDYNLINLILGGIAKGIF